MKSKAPDTRNKLDSNAGIKRQTIKKRTSNAPRSVGDLVRIMAGDLKPLPVKNKETNGEIFKKANGYTKTRKRQLKKHGLTPFMMDQYKDLIKKRKAREKAIRQEKRKVSTTNRRLKGKSSNTPKKK